MALLGFSIICTILLIILTLACEVKCSRTEVGYRSHKLRRRRVSTLNEERFLKFRFIAEPADSYTINGRVKLSCSYSFSKQKLANSSTDWFKDNSLIGDSDSHIKITKKQNVSAEFEEINKRIGIDGVYYCKVTVIDAGTSWTYLSKKAIVRAPYLSRFEKQPFSVGTGIGESVAFECSLSSYPPAKFDWFHNNRKLDAGTDGSITIYPVTSAIEITNVQLRHRGSYRCFANNGLSNRSSEDAYLDVAERVSTRSRPSFILAPRDAVVKEGNPLTLECLINGASQSDIRWWKDSKILVVDGKKVRTVGTSSLFIQSISANDAGNYECRADAVKLNSTATITVSAAPAIIRAPKDVVAQEKADAEFECIVSGNPGAQIRWFKNGEAIIASEYFMVEGPRLKILGLVLKDQAVYQCIAENDIGSVQASAQLIVERSGSSLLIAGSDGPPRLPSEPLGLRLTNIGSRFVTLAWDQPLHPYGSLIMYHVYYKEIGSQRERNINATTTSCTIPSLQPNTSYLFRVVAVNEAGPGKSSVVFPVTTSKEQAVPGKIRNLRARAVGSETIEVSWDAPISDLPGTEVQNYILFYIQAQNVASERETQITTDENSYVLRGMAKYTEYRIRVEAEGRNGPGLSSNIVTVKTFSDSPSGSPTNVRAYALSRNSVQVIWDPVRLEEQNGEIIGYRLKYKSKYRNNKVALVDIDGKTSSFDIDGLEPGVEYVIRLAAKNVNGTGPFCNAVKVVTLLEDKDESHVPPPPQKLILRPSAESILVIWDPPSDPGVMIRKYQLGWGPSVPDIHTVNLDIGARNYTIMGLDKNREYVVSLLAVNKRGPGFPIFESALTSANSHMDSFSDSVSSASVRTPVEVRAETLSSSAILVSWTDLDSLLPETRMYSVKCTSNAERSAEPRQNKVTRNQVVMEGLYPNTQYECVVRVEYDDYKSPWSMAAINKTFPTPPSSAPCDLTLSPSEDDPHTVTLSWQPPKYANGDINEYLIYYTHEPDRPTEDWYQATVEGNQMTYTITDLLPRTTYFFKVQARNVKGLGPISKVKRFDLGAPSPRQFQIPPVNEPVQSSTFFSSSIFIAVASVTILLLIVLIILVVWCVKAKESRKGTSGGYVAGKKSVNDGRSPPDLWIDHTHGHHIKDFSGESPSASSSDLKRIGNAGDSAPPRYQSLQANGFNSNRRASSALGGYSSPAAMMQPVPEHSEHRIIGIAEAIPVHPLKCITDCQSNGTLTRSYHQSSSSLESRQRTPQVVYNGSNRYLPSAKIDYSDHGSSYGSSQALQPQTPPPQLPNQGPPSGPPSQMSDGYRTLRGNSSNPLKSFTQLAGAPPPLSPSQAERAAHVVRPVVIASPCSRGKPAGIVIGHKSAQVPIGRAAAQPRVNVNNIYASFASCAPPEKAVLKGDVDNRLETQPLQPSNSTEELNAQMENLDTMIDDLQAMQHEFNASS